MFEMFLACVNEWLTQLILYRFISAVIILTAAKKRAGDGWLVPPITPKMRLGKPSQRFNQTFKRAVQKFVHMYEPSLGV